MWFKFYHIGTYGTIKTKIPMKKFMDENFLLQTKTAQDLYHNHAVNMPIFDYHCHINPKQIADDVQFENITQIWLYGDHYKWRGMRTNGVDEKYSNGDAREWGQN